MPNIGANIGIDIVSIPRIARLYSHFGSRFLQRILNESEIALLDSNSSNNSVQIRRLAGFYAAKEAASKALKTGIGSRLSFKDLEISKNNKNNKSPEIALKEHKIADLPYNFELSITHDGDFAVAVVLAFNRYKL
ncbi:MAG: holo-ACP synthase [Helicobacter sp.]|nr:holo-ACP synthase [Helicobacter sp.]